MNYLVIDTETSTFPLTTVEPTSHAQARIVQLCAILVDDKWNEVEVLYEILKPPFDDFRISPGAQEVHGISVQDCIEKGKPRRDVMKAFKTMHDKASYIVAHNLKFDTTMLGIEFCNHLDLMEDDNEMKVLGTICTMQETTELCKLPFLDKRNFGKKYKWPKLEQALNILCGCNLDGAHDSLNDCRGTIKLLRYLVENGHVISTDSLLV